MNKGKTARFLIWAMVIALPVTLYASETGGNSPSVSVERDGTSVIVSWRGLAGSLVKVELCRGDRVLADLSGWMENTGSFEFVPAQVVSEHPGDVLRLRVVSDLEAPIWSDGIIIEAPLAVSIDQARTPPVVSASWSGGGNPVRVELYRDGSPVTNLSGWIDNTGYWTGELPDDLETAEDYYIVVSATTSLVGGSGMISIDGLPPGPSVIPLIPGEEVAVSFDAPGSRHVFRFDARQLMAYRFLTEGTGQLRVEILDADMEPIHSYIQQPGEATPWWDCWETETYHAALESEEEIPAGDCTISMEEFPGWENATLLEHKKKLRGVLEYHGDVDYYFFDRGERQREFSVEAVGLPSLRLFWVNTADERPEALVMGSELMMLENFPGAEIEPGGYSYYGVTGGAGEYTIEMRASGKGSATVLIIVGISLGVVLLAAVIAASSDSCGDSCGDYFADRLSIDGCDGCGENLEIGRGCMGRSGD